MQILFEPPAARQRNPDLALAGRLAPRLKQTPELAPGPTSICCCLAGAQPPLPGWRRLCPVVGHEPD